MNIKKPISIISFVTAGASWAFIIWHTCMSGEGWGNSPYVAYIAAFAVILLFAMGNFMLCDEKSETGVMSIGIMNVVIIILLFINK